MRVLIVEDSDSIVRMIQALMSARGFEVRSAPSGARGLEGTTGRLSCEPLGALQSSPA